MLATQNPIEQEGTYPLPEAQVDRFMLQVVIDYPKLEEEKLIIRQKDVYKRQLHIERTLTTPKHYAYLKISEGCDRKCYYCAIPVSYTHLDWRY